jgi:hypothetical protein
VVNGYQSALGHARTNVPGDLKTLAQTVQRSTIEYAEWEVTHENLPHSATQGEIGESMREL